MFPSFFFSLSLSHSVNLRLAFCENRFLFWKCGVCSFDVAVRVRRRWRWIVPGETRWAWLCLLLKNRCLRVRVEMSVQSPTKPCSGNKLSLSLARSVFVLSWCGVLIKLLPFCLLPMCLVFVYLIGMHWNRIYALNLFGSFWFDVLSFILFKVLGGLRTEAGEFPERMGQPVCQVLVKQCT